MCGVAGFVDASGGWAQDKMEHIVGRMAARLRARGPDDAGTWVDPGAGVALGHRRLSIIDLSPAGHQPMTSASGRYVIAYNGEAYNFEEIRKELEGLGRRFRGHSDTEVVVEAIDAWGIERTLARLIGMFAFAVWDRQERALTLVRDRLGIKPLYWGWSGGILLFGSQPSAFVEHPAWRPAVDRDALASYVRHNYVPAPLSIFRGIEKLEPGCLVTIGPDGTARRTRYWDLRGIAREGVADRLTLGDVEAADALDDLLRDAVKQRMIADVPLGAFLSGGIDSSTVVALMQAQSSIPVRTFSIGFHEDGYDEAVHAKAVAAHLATDHTELYVEPSHAIEVLPRMPEWYDEPFADSSQVPTFLVSELTRRHVTVALSGDGGDELFAGYNRYAWGEDLWRRFVRWPRALRFAAAALAEAVPPAGWDHVFRLLPRSVRPPQAGDKVHKLAGLLKIGGREALYRRLVSQWGDPEAVVREGREVESVLWDPTVSRDIPDFTERMQFLDAVTYLPDDILTKVDRASMAVSLEARVPLLDHRVVEFAWRLPKSMKVRDGRTKWLLRQVLDRYVPRTLFERPKMGFGVPIDHWLRTELRDWAEGLLAEKRLREGGYFDPATVRRAWTDHLSGRHNLQYQLWTILMFEAWRDEWGIGPP
jgi:asparagine synthase (glutamine-hydrolysing)